jgi:hypothetical protein
MTDEPRRPHPGLAEGEAFVERVERESDAGNADFIEANMPEIERRLAVYMEWTNQLAGLAFRLRQVRNRHEPPAGERLRKES